MRIPAAHVHRGDARTALGRQQLSRGLAERFEGLGSEATPAFHGIATAAHVGREHAVGEGLGLEALPQGGSQQRIARVELRHRLDEAGRCLVEARGLVRGDRHGAAEDERRCTADRKAQALFTFLQRCQRAIEPAIGDAALRGEA